MATKFKIDLIASGSLNDEIVKMVTNHNEGKVSISLSLIGAFIHIKHAIYPIIYENISFTECSPSNELLIKENGKHTLTIQEIEVEPLVIQPDSEAEREIREETENDLKEINI